MNISKLTNKKQLHAAVKDLLKLRENIIMEDDSIVMFTLGAEGIIVGKEDTDKIYLWYGWDYTSCPNDDEPITYIVVSEPGRAFLQYSKHKVVTMSTNYRMSFILDEMATSFAQQRLDYLRRLVKNKELDYPIVGCKVNIESSGNLRKAYITSLRINSKSVSVRLDDKDSFLLYDEKGYKFDAETISILLRVNEIIEQQKGMIFSLILDNANTLKAQRMRNADTYNIFLRGKSHGHHNVIVLVSEKAFFITFDDDALLLAKYFNLPLYHCRMISSRDHTVAYIDNYQFQNLVEDGELESRVMSQDIKRELYDFGFTPSILNFKGRDDLPLKNISICKSTDGYYYVQATTGDNVLTPVVIPGNVGTYYSSLGNGKEKEMLLTSVAHHAYDNRV